MSFMQEDMHLEQWAYSLFVKAVHLPPEILITRKTR